MMNNLMRGMAVLAMAFTLSSTIKSASAAETVEHFYKGKQINIYIGTGENAGAVVAYPRVMADVMGQYIPGNPTFIVRFMPGAGGIKASNYIYSIAPQDGTIYGFITRGFILAPILSDQAQFDPTKFQWIGSTSREPSVGAVWNATTTVRTFEDARKTETIMGATSMGQDTGIFPSMLNKYAGTKFKIVPGYKSSPDIELAMQRGEVTGKVGWTWGAINGGNTRTWLPEGKVTLLVQLGLTKYGKIPADVPLAMDLAQSEEGRQVIQLICSPAATGYPSFVGPGVPKDRVDAIRTAYVKTMTDPKFLAGTKQQQMTVDPMSGDEIDKIVKDLYAMPADVKAKAKELMPTAF
jgi:tripartite-type tricarboxylate transporter receptor subunit TctC